MPTAARLGAEQVERSGRNEDASEDGGDGQPAKGRRSFGKQRDR